MRLAQETGAKVMGTAYDDAVTLTLRMLDGTQQPFLTQLTELERGKEQVSVSDPIEAEF